MFTLTSANAPNLWGAASYAWDTKDNLTGRTMGAHRWTYTHDATNRLTQIDADGVPSAYAYDAQSNVTARGTQGYYFDQASRLTLVHGVASYGYDGLQNRGNQRAADSHPESGQDLYP